MSTPTPVKLDFFDPKANDCPYHAYAFSHHQNFFLRALREVHVGFEPVENWTKSGAARSTDTKEG